VKIRREERSVVERLRRPVETSSYLGVSSDEAENFGIFEVSGGELAKVDAQALHSPVFSAVLIIKGSQWCPRRQFNISKPR
jgi:hypothetical protein